MASNGCKPPNMHEGLPYGEWKKELEIWADFTDLDSKRKGGALFLTLTGKAREAVLAGVTRDKIKSDTGLEEILKCLDELYEKDKSQCAFAAFDDFTNYRRPHNCNIQDYIVEFNLKYSRINTQGMNLPDGVLAYYLLKCANLTEEQSNICKATCSVLDYKTMRMQIEKITSAINKDQKKAETENVDIQPQFYCEEYEDEYPDDQEEIYEDFEQVQDTFYNRQYHPKSSGYQRGQGSARGTQPYMYNTGNYQSKPRQNPPDEFGNPTRCSFCRSIYHWVEKCPDAQRNSNNPQRRPYRKPSGRGFYRAYGNPGKDQSHDRRL